MGEGWESVIRVTRASLSELHTGMNAGCMHDNVPGINPSSILRQVEPKTRLVAQQFLSPEIIFSMAISQSSSDINKPSLQKDQDSVVRMLDLASMRTFTLYASSLSQTGLQQH